MDETVPGTWYPKPDTRVPFRCGPIARLPSAECQAVRELAVGSWELGWEMAVGSWDGRWHRERAAARLGRERPCGVVAAQRTSADVLPGEYDLGKSGWSYGVGSWDGWRHQYSSRLPSANSHPICQLPSAVSRVSPSIPSAVCLAFKSRMTCHEQARRSGDFSR